MDCSIPDTILQRKGATKEANIPVEVQQLLHSGMIESVNLTEWLAVDHITLLEHVLPEVGLEKKLPDLLLEIKETDSSIRGMKAIRLIGQRLYQSCSTEDAPVTDSEPFMAIAEHRSDSVRCWGAYMAGGDDSMSIDEALSRIHRFAADSHFGVREIAWMAVRAHIESNLSEAISILSTWTTDADANVRRFATEATRPRGVWTKHIEALKQSPWQALPLLEPLKSDPAKYVQDSVGNWLNDASKTNPDWVRELCERWTNESDSKATARIVSKAQRTLLKQA